MAGDAVTAEIEELKKKLSQNPESLIFVPLADAYRKSGMLDDAIEVCTKGLEKHPTYTSARVVLGRIYLEKDMLNEASEELKKVEAVDVDNIMVHSMLGNIYLKKKMYAEAIDQFQRVLSLNPEDIDTQEKLKEALAFKQEPEVVQNPQPQPKKAEEKKPETKKEPLKDVKPKIDITKSLKAAELYTKKEEFDKAVEIYKEILDGDSENLIVQQRLREVYSLQEKKLYKEKERDKGATAAAKNSEAPVSDKITAEDILDVMKHAVEDEDVEIAEEKKKETKQEPKREEKKEEKKEIKPAASKTETSKKISLAPAKVKDIEAILKELQNVDGLTGSLLISRDGSLVANMLPKSINIDEASQVISTIVEKTEQMVRDTKQGKLNQVVIASQKGQLLFNEIWAGVLFMLGDENINVGKMRLILKDVIEKIKKVAA